MTMILLSGGVNPKIKQIVDLRKSDKLTKNYCHYFIIYIDFY